MTTNQKIDGRTYTQYTTKETAQFVRAALKAAFPGVKFSVRTAYASMYSATQVQWTDGPTVPEVDRVLAVFTSKTFDGSDDSTHYHTQTVDGALVQYSGWINTTRTVSPALHALAVERARHLGEENVHAVAYTMRPNGCRVILKPFNHAAR